MDIFTRGIEQASWGSLTLNKIDEWETHTLKINHQESSKTVTFAMEVVLSAVVGYLAADLTRTSTGTQVFTISVVMWAVMILAVILMGKAVVKMFFPGFGKQLTYKLDVVPNDPKAMLALGEVHERILDLVHKDTFAGRQALHRAAIAYQANQKAEMNRNNYDIGNGVMLTR